MGSALRARRRRGWRRPASIAMPLVAAHFHGQGRLEALVLGPAGDATRPPAPTSADARRACSCAHRRRREDGDRQTREAAGTDVFLDAARARASSEKSSSRRTRRCTFSGVGSAGYVATVHRRAPRLLRSARGARPAFSRKVRRRGRAARREGAVASPAKPRSRRPTSASPSTSLADVPGRRHHRERQVRRRSLRAGVATAARCATSACLEATPAAASVQDDREWLPADGDPDRGHPSARVVPPRAAPRQLEAPAFNSLDVGVADGRGRARRHDERGLRS